ncbi:hypothetical protein [Streptomyces sp. NBC_01438]|uniref:hypothetical protein n=1 Tax=Streptomyces sp. NBC_01438 TaxID=2903866 RepID=UPI00352E55F6
MTQLFAVGVGAVALVAEQGGGSSAGPAGATRDGWDAVDQGEGLSEEKWPRRLTDADRRAPSPLFWTHVDPYGRFELDMNSHLDLAVVAQA